MVWALSIQWQALPVAAMHWLQSASVQRQWRQTPDGNAGAGPGRLCLRGRFDRWLTGWLI